ncbi:Cyclin, C-terminal domain [Dillenia turbinata]|uniref:Cyclin, C-terminal domain n=1 Tax=Dillenia turbinata TaxID=194707 RepID=A0AAN8UJ17_9MAGN
MSVFHLMALNCYWAMLSWFWRNAEPGIACAVSVLDKSILSHRYEFHIIRPSNPNIQHLVNQRFVKMNTENSIHVGVTEPSGCITRARAAALHACTSTHLSKFPTKLVQKRISKRAVLDESSAKASAIDCPQNKRRAVLKNIANVCREHSHINCLNASKVEVKASEAHKKNKQARKASSELLISKKNMAQASKEEEISSEKQMSLIKVKEYPDGFMEAQLAKRSSSHAFLLLSSSTKAERNMLHKSLGFSDEADVIDIDSDQKDPLLCSLYAADIYGYLRVAELTSRPSSSFMEIVQRDITQSMRAILIDWLVEVSEEYKLVPDTLYLTVHLIDLFLSENYIERQRLQLLGITCMLIASKYEEICAPRVEDFCFITDSTYTREEVLKMESQVLNYFNFHITVPTYKTCLRRFLRAAQALNKVPSLELEYLANYLTELTLVDYAFLNFVPSMVAASAVFLARWTLDQSTHPWNTTLQYYTTYTASDLKTAVLALQDLQLNTKGCPLNAVRTKYRQDKFKSVASLSSPDVIQTLF